MSADYKDRIYREYYRTHILPRKGAVTIDHMRRAMKVFDFHFGRFLPADKSSIILDAGCGNGSLVHWLHQHGYHSAAGVDTSVDQIEAGQSLGIKNLHIQNMVEYLLQNKGGLDVIFMRDVLEHIDKSDVLGVLDACFEALKPSGKLVLQVPNGASPMVGRVLYGDFTHEYALTESSLSQLFRLCGFSSLDFFPYLPFQPKFKWTSLLTKRGWGAVARAAAWKLARSIYDFLIFAEVGAHSTITTFNLIAVGTKPASTLTEDDPDSREVAPASAHGEHQGQAAPHNSRRLARGVRAVLWAPFRLLIRFMRFEARVRRRARHWISDKTRTAGRRLFSHFIALFARTIPAPSDHPRCEDVRQILVFGDMGIGNFLMLTPLLRALRNNFDKAEIVTLFLKGRGVDGVAQSLDTIDRCVSLPIKGRFSSIENFRLYFRLKAMGIKPDLVVSRWNSGPYPPALAVLLRAPWRVGHVSSAGFRGFCDRAYNFPVTMDIAAHEVERNLDLVRHIGIELSGPVSSEFPLSEHNFARADALLNEKGIDPAKLICLQVGSSNIQDWKRWPGEHWAVLTEGLARAGLHVAFLGTAEEKPAADAVISAAGPARNAVFNLCGALSLHETGALLARSALLICNDSGLMHVAAAVGVKVIGIFGPTEFDRTRPFTDNCILLRGKCECSGSLFDRRVIKKISHCDRPCLRSVEPAQVLQEALSFLSRDTVNV